MSVSRSASRSFSRLGSFPEKCLLRSSKVSSSSRAYSTPRAIQSTPTPYTKVRLNRSGHFTNRLHPIRPFSLSATAFHNHLTPPKAGEELHITFVDKDGEEHSFEVAKGDNLLDIAQDNDIEMEGACGGSCACSTCHIIVESEDLYDKIPEPDDDENDMLDLAFGLTETSRLGCQVKMSPEIDGLRVKLPSMTRNLQASDFSKKSGK